MMASLGRDCQYHFERYAFKADGMAAKSHWIKLYTEILDDPKMGTLPDRLYRRVIELFLLAGVNRENGNLPDLQTIAWRLRLSIDELSSDLAAIEKTGIITEAEPYRWVVSKFAERQAPADPTAAARMQALRDRNAAKKVTDDIGKIDEIVTRNVTDTLRVNLRVESESESETEREQERAQAGEDHPSNWIVENLPATTTAVKSVSKFQSEIGMLSPKTSDMLMGWVDDYSDEWTSDAIDEAVKNNVRKPTYIDAILKNWKANGRNGTKPKPSLEDQGYHYVITDTPS